MKLWLISQDQNNGYDTYDSAVVAAENEVLAKTIHPSGYYVWVQGKVHFKFSDGHTELAFSNNWASDLDAVKVEFLGEAKEGTEEGIICASFNAG